MWGGLEFRGNGASKLALGDQLPGVIMNRDIPHMFAAPDMNGFTGGGNETFRGWTQMIGGDDRTDRIFFFQVDTHQRGKAAHGFGQNAGGAAMQYAVNLVRAFINRKAGFDKIRAHFNKLKAKMVQNIIRRNEGVNFGNGISFAPDHGHYASAFMGVRP